MNGHPEQKSAAMLPLCQLTALPQGRGQALIFPATVVGGTLKHKARRVLVAKDHRQAAVEAALATTVSAPLLFFFFFWLKIA